MDSTDIEIKQEPIGNDLDEFDIDTSYIVKTEAIDYDNSVKDETLPEIKQEEIDEELEDSNYDLLQAATYTVEEVVEIDPLEQSADDIKLEDARALSAERRLLKKFKKTSMSRCTVCKAKFFSEHTLELHMKTHNADKVFECEKCNDKYHTLGELMHHQKISRHFRPTDSFEEKVRLLNKRKFKCPRCRIVFYSERTYKMHSRTHSGELKYACTDCQEKFGTISDLTRHKEQTRHGLGCKECGTTCSTIEEMEQHKKMHTKWKFYKCPDCNFSSVVQRHLRQHRIQHCRGGSTAGDAEQSAVVAVTCIACKSSFDNTDTYLKHNCAGGDVIENIIAETETIGANSVQEVMVTEGNESQPTTLMLEGENGDIYYAEIIS